VLVPLHFGQLPVFVDAGTRIQLPLSAAGRNHERFLSIEYSVSSPGYHPLSFHDFVLMTPEANRVASARCELSHIPSDAVCLTVRSRQYEGIVDTGETALNRARRLIRVRCWQP